MMNRLLPLIALAFSITWNTPVSAQSGPIFITPPSQQNTASNNIPTVVSPTQQRGASANEARTRALIERNSRLNTNSGYQFRELTNPYEGTAFGRIRREKDYFDRETGVYVNQYDYMKLLAERGNQAQLAQVRNFLQQNGVFNPQKYQQVMASIGTSNENANGAGTASGTNATMRPRTVIQTQNPQGNNVPQRIHQGYDNDPDPIEPMKNRPIFLR